MNQFYEIVNAYFIDFLENSENSSVLNWKKDKQDFLQKIIKKEYKNLQNKNKTNKLKRPSDAPKKPRSGYILFLQDQQIILKTEKQELKQYEILKEVGALWRSISEKVKSKYTKLAEKDKERFNYEMENYEYPKEYLDSIKEYKKIQKDNRNEDKRLYPNKPKQAKNAFLIFSHRERENIKLESRELKAKEILVELGIRWQKIKDTNEVEEYNESAKEDKERYEKEYKLFLIEKANKMGEDNEILDKKIIGVKKKLDKKHKITKEDKYDIKNIENEKSIQIDNSETISELKEDHSNFSNDLIDYEAIIREIISENEYDITKKCVKLELLKRNIKLEKEQLNNIIEKIQNE